MSLGEKPLLPGLFTLARPVRGGLHGVAEELARYFAGPRVHHQVAGAGHNLPQEAPRAFTAAVPEVAGLR